jgi:hypothetical protein
MRLNYNLTEIHKGKIDRAIRTVQKKILATKQDIYKMGDEVLQSVLLKIETSKKNPQSPHTDKNAKASSKSLMESIKLERFDLGDYYGWGIGKIAELEKYSPHFLAVNYGSSHIIGKSVFGKFEGGLFKWNHPEGSFIIPSNPIPAINYIETGNENLRLGVKLLQVRLTK